MCQGQWLKVKGQTIKALIHLTLSLSHGPSGVEGHKNDQSDFEELKIQPVRGFRQRTIDSSGF